MGKKRCAKYGKGRNPSPTQSKKRDALSAGILENGRYVSIIRTEMIREGNAPYDGQLTDVKAAARFAGQFFQNATRESLVVVSLDAKGSPIAAEVVSVGLLSSCPVGIPEVFRHAILACAEAILCFHNHPASSMLPTREDLQATKRLKEAGDLLGIRLLDHLIIGRDGSFLSLAKEGYL